MSVFRAFLVRIQSEGGKKRTWKTPNTDIFDAVLVFAIALQLCWITLRNGCSPVNLLHIFRTPLDSCFCIDLNLIYFHITKIIRARNVLTGCNIKHEPWLQMLNPGSAFLALDLQSGVSAPECCVFDPGSWALGTGSWALGLVSQVSGPKSCVLLY